MQIHNLTRKTPLMKMSRVGRGGKRGKTSGRGTKGQNARSGRKIYPEIRDMIKKIPKLRGRGKNSNLPIYKKVAAVNVGSLEKYFAAGDTVTPNKLVALDLVRSISGQAPIVKILSVGELTKKLTIRGCVASAVAREKVLKAGGTIS